MNDEIFTVLKELFSLLNAGIIDNKEYDQKKLELLNSFNQFDIEDKSVFLDELNGLLNSGIINSKDLDDLKNRLNLVEGQAKFNEESLLFDSGLTNDNVPEVEVDSDLQDYAPNEGKIRWKILVIIALLIGGYFVWQNWDEIKYSEFYQRIETLVNNDDSDQMYVPEIPIFSDDTHSAIEEIDSSETLYTGNSNFDNLLKVESKRAIEELNLTISQYDLSVLIYEHCKEYWASDIEDGGIEHVTIEVMKLNEDLLQINTSWGTASSNRYSLIKNTDNYYHLIDEMEALQPVFAKLYNIVGTTKSFNGAYLETIDGKSWLVFEFYMREDAACCPSIKVATIGQLDSYNRFKTDGLMYYNQKYSPYWEVL
ncbi:hypothetical protein NLM59_07535 [Weeksellaceae bacterium KMM 9724]|uniref:hypothetical protein n=1 Tax=Profundicola chukchiensis TaxID=2961959 RepID=UPI00243774FA|nr:hypothetical protein [Profundicola chukchiensis]MDG4950773.1 hypothetical protein [Profundicola chukchiensis]